MMNFKNTYLNKERAVAVALQRSKERGYRTVYLYEIPVKYDDKTGRMTQNRQFKVSTTKYDKPKGMVLIDSILAESPNSRYKNRRKEDEENNT